MYYGRKAEPLASKVTYARDKERSFARHRARLKHMKSSIDNKPPRQFKHLKRNLKKEQMMEDRYAEIEHENRVLLNKMSEIMQKKGMDTTTTSHKFGHSLNRPRRKAELQRITADNQKLLQRIQGAMPVYNHWEWEEDRAKQEEYIQNICEYKPHTIKGRRRRGGASGPLAASGAASMAPAPPRAGLLEGSASVTGYYPGASGPQAHGSFGMTVGGGGAPGTGLSYLSAGSYGAAAFPPMAGADAGSGMPGTTPASAGHPWGGGTAGSTGSTGFGLHFPQGSLPGTAAAARGPSASSAGFSGV